MRLVWDAYSIDVASKTGLTDMKRATVMLRGAVTDSGHQNGTQRDPKSGISGRENIGAKV